MKGTENQQAALIFVTI